MKKAFFVAFVLALVVPATAVLAGAKSETAASTGAAQSRPVVFMAYVGHTSSDAYYQRLHDYIEQQTGVKFTFRDVMTNDDFKVQKTAAIAAQEQIDAFTTDSTELATNRTKGVIQDITDAVNTYGANMKKLFSNPPGWEGFEPGAMWRAATIDGRIWAVPGATGKDVGVVLSVRKDWREKLGVGPIDTIDQFEAYLRKVKGTDLNGNGTADEIPFNPMYGTDGLEGIASTMVYPFVGAVGWMHEWYMATYLSGEGQITPTVLHPGFRTFLAKMAQWYKEGLINPDVQTLTWDNDNDLLAADRVGATASWYSDFYTAWGSLKEKVPAAEYEHVVLKGPDGAPAKFALFNPAFAKWSYTSWSPKDVVAAGIKLQDWFAANKDNYLVQWHGVQGTDWKYVNKGADTVRPEIQHISDPEYESYSFLDYNNWNGFVLGNMDFAKTATFAANKVLATKQAWFPPDWFVAYDWSGTKIKDNYNDAATFVNEAVANVILGRATLADWDKAMAQFREMWANEFVKVATQQYNAAKGK
jgi:putative aldouronate transport system substrate-binding protein